MTETELLDEVYKRLPKFPLKGTYKQAKLLDGHGGTGSVYLYRKDGPSEGPEMVAVKVSGPQFGEQVLKEAEMLIKARGLPGIVECYGVIDEFGTYALVEEAFLKDDDWHKLEEAVAGKNDLEILQMLEGVLETVNLIHEKDLWTQFEITVDHFFIRKRNEAMQVKAIDFSYGTSSGDAGSFRFAGHLFLLVATVLSRRQSQREMITVEKIPKVKEMVDPKFHVLLDEFSGKAGALNLRRVLKRVAGLIERERRYSREKEFISQWADMGDSSGEGDAMVRALVAAYGRMSDNLQTIVGAIATEKTAIDRLIGETQAVKAEVIDIKGIASEIPQIGNSLKDVLGLKASLSDLSTMVGSVQTKMIEHETSTVHSAVEAWQQPEAVEALRSAVADALVKTETSIRQEINNAQLRAGVALTAEEIGVVVRANVKDGMAPSLDQLNAIAKATGVPPGKHEISGAAAPQGTPIGAEGKTDAPPPAWLKTIWSRSVWRNPAYWVICIAVALLIVGLLVLSKL